MSTQARMNSKIQHWMQEQIYDAVENLEGRLNKEEVKKNGEVKTYTNGDAEFWWKGKLAIFFPQPEVDSLQMLDIQAFHIYDDNRRCLMSEHNKEN